MASTVILRGLKLIIMRKKTHAQSISLWSQAEYPSYSLFWNHKCGWTILCSGILTLLLPIYGWTFEFFGFSQMPLTLARAPGSIPMRKKTHLAMSPLFLPPPSLPPKASWIWLTYSGLLLDTSFPNPSSAGHLTLLGRGGVAIWKPTRVGPARMEPESTMYYTTTRLCQMPVMIRGWDWHGRGFEDSVLLGFFVLFASTSNANVYKILWSSSNNWSGWSTQIRTRHESRPQRKRKKVHYRANNIPILSYSHQNTLLL